MTIGVVQSAEVETSVLDPRHTTQTATFPGTPTPGNTLVAILSRDSPVLIGTINNPSGWTQRVDVAQATQLRIVTKVAGVAEPTGVTFTFDDTRRSALVIMEINGAYAGNASAYGTASVQSIPSVTPAAGVEALLIAAAVAHNAYSITGQPSGYTSVQEIVADDGGSERLSTWSKHVATTSGSYTGSVTYASTVESPRAQLWFLASAPAVIADFSGTPLSGDAPMSVSFTDLSSGSPTSWAWTFGDGGTSTSQNPTHNYTTPGTYTVTLTATSGAGSDSETKTSYVTVLPVTPGAVLLDVYDITTGVAIYQGSITDATDKKFQAQYNGVGSISFKLNRYSPNASLVQADRLLKIRIPQIHSDYIFAGFIDAPTATLVHTDEKGGEFLDVQGRGALAYWANAIWLSDAFVLPWWTCDDDPPAGAKGQVEVKANGGPQAGGKYRIYHISAGVIDASDPYDEVTVSSDDCWYFDSRKTYLWPSENNKRFLVHLLTGPYADDYFHPNQDGVTETLKTVAIGDTIELGTITPDKPGAILRHMYDEAATGSRPTNPLPIMSIDFTDALDSDGNAWSTNDAVAGMTVNVGDQYLDTVGKLLSTGVLDVDVDPTVAGLGFRAYNAPHGRDLTSATFAANKVRFEKGVNIADTLRREARDVQVATFSEVAGTDDVYVQVELPDPTGRVPREVAIRGDTNDETALEALGLADLEQRLAHSDAVGFNITLGNDEDVGLYLPGPRGSDNGKFWTGDTVTAHTGTGQHDFDEADALVANITLFEDEGGNLRCTVEVGTGLGPNQRGHYGSGLASSPGSTGADGSFVSRTSAGSVGAVEVGTGITDHGLLAGLSADDHSAYETVIAGGGPTAQDHGSMGATETIDAANGNRHRGVLDDDCTITVAPFADGSIDFAVTQDGTGGWGITWSGVTVPDDDQPSQGAGETTVFVLFSDDGVVTLFKAGGGTAVGALDDLSDVTITAPAEDDTLRYVSGVWVNDTRRWEPVTFNFGTGPELVWDADDLVMEWKEY